MSRLIATILLAILMFPLAVLVFFVTFVTYLVVTNYDREETGLIFSGLVTCAFVGLYWLALWRKVVVWTPQRRLNTVGAALGAAAAGFVAGLMFTHAIDAPRKPELALFIATLIAPLVWIFATILFWRETSAERAARVASLGADALTCPTCGYNLTGLRGTRCPECGNEFTLDQILASQPSRAAVELES